MAKHGVGCSPVIPVCSARLTIAMCALHLTWYRIDVFQPDDELINFRQQVYGAISEQAISIYARVVEVGRWRDKPRKAALRRIAQRHACIQFPPGPFYEPVYHQRFNHALLDAVFAIYLPLNS
ncbi:hypothetical protein [Nitrosospira sp. Nsp11]|uniref:hypothetical protein n=1 Tax=Nitrosospira sp. Nsp11 TaxID=1855338 RepID=UPI001160D74B|nr:hypothetical protein [Nitrosospira sp. Nsp11]